MAATIAIIFDFDGTLADSFEVSLEVINVILKHPLQLSSDEIAELRKSSTKQIIKKLGIKPWQIPLLIARGRREMSARMEQVEAFKGVPELLVALSSKYALYILSTNSNANITKFLDKYQLSRHFQGIYGNIGLSKAKNLKSLAKREKFPASSCLYIGDETRDVVAAHKAGMKCIAVKWGYNDPDALSSCRPEALSGTPQDLVRLIDELAQATA